MLKVNISFDDLLRKKEKKEKKVLTVLAAMLCVKNCVATSFSKQVPMQSKVDD